MDPVTLILGALAAGVAAGVSGTASAGVTDAYAGLKHLLTRRFRAEPETRAAIESAGGDPDADAVVAARLRAVGPDPQILRAAAAVMDHADPAGFRVGKYQVTITGSKGVVIGDFNQVTQHFGDD